MTYELYPDPGTGNPSPIETEADVLALMPHFVKKSDSAPVRDAIAAGLRAIAGEFQKRAGYAGACTDILRANGVYLEEKLGSIGCYRQPGESDTDYRLRGLTAPETVSPEAILAVVEAITSIYSSAKPQLFESVSDRWYISASGTTWRSYVGASPSYPDRLYPEDSASNGGYVRLQSMPGGACVFTNGSGRYFLVRIPDIEIADETITSMFTADVTPPLDAGYGFFVFDGTAPDVNAYLRRTAIDSISVFASIINAVSRIKGHGIRWQLISDPRL